MNTVQRALNVATQFVEEGRLAPDEARLTLPSVLAEQGRQFVVVAYHMGQGFVGGPRQPRKIYFPFLELRVLLPEHDPTARLISPDDFGLVLPTREYIGDLGDLMRFDLDAYEERRDRYEELLSTVADQGWLIQPTSSPATRDSAGEMSMILEEISESALEPYYASSMKTLRAWLAQQGHPVGSPSR